MTTADISGCHAEQVSESVRTWLIASAIMVGIWAAISLMTGKGIYPWFIWPVGIWGAIELFSWMSKRDGREGS